MNFFEAFFLGGLQGLAEFLPVSSSGHLALFQHFFSNQLSHEEDFFLNILLHFATMLALLIYFRNDIFSLLKNLFFGKKEKHSFFAGQEKKFFLSLIIAVFATGVVGFALKRFALDASNNVSLIGAFFICTSIVLWLSQKTKPVMSFLEFRYRDALIIGVVQGIAVFPGLSRSGLTICAALFLGLDRTTSAKYSLFLAIPTIAAVTFVELFDMADHHFTVGYLPLFAMLIAGIIGYFAIHWIQFFVSRNKFHYFSPYLLLLGLLLLFI